MNIVPPEKNIDDLQKEIDAQIEFMTIVAHQLKTPLTGIKWSFKMLLNDELGPLTDEQRQVLEEGYQNNERTIVLVDEMRQASKARMWNFVYHKQVLDFTHHVQTIIDEFIPTSKSKHVPITVSMSGIPSPVFADPTKISIVLENLIDNAFKYTPEDGDHDITVTLTYSETGALFSIHNDGTTVTESDIPVLFEKYSRGTLAKQSHITSTGLGLFTAKRIIEGHDGTIHFVSDAHTGTTVSFTLPFAENIITG